MIEFKDLSAPLKAAIVLAWFFGAMEVLYFIAGFVIGFAGL